MKEKIKKLKGLALVYKVAEAYDYCPSLKELDELLKDGIWLTSELLHWDRGELENLLKDHEGEDCDRISDHIILQIRNLPL